MHFSLCHPTIHPSIHYSRTELILQIIIFISSSAISTSIQNNSNNNKYIFINLANKNGYGMQKKRNKFYEKKENAKCAQFHIQVYTERIKLKFQLFLLA